MPRIRTVKPEFWQDEKLSPLDPLTRLVFLGLISMADDAGRLVDSVKAIDGFLFMNTNDTAHEALMKLAGIGRIERGVTASGQRVIQIVGWAKHQKIQHANLAAALPEIVAQQDDSPSHEPLMNNSGAVHEPLMPHINDLRSTTNDHRSFNHWVDPFAVEWEVYCGVPSKPKLTLGLSPLIGAHGLPQVFIAWRGYLRDLSDKGKIEFASAASFGQRYLAHRRKWSAVVDTDYAERPIADMPGLTEFPPEYPYTPPMKLRKVVA